MSKPGIQNNTRLITVEADFLGFTARKYSDGSADVRDHLGGIIKEWKTAPDWNEVVNAVKDRPANN